MRAIGATRRWVLESEPTGDLETDLFGLREESLGEPRDGQFVLRTLWIGTDPGLIRRLRDERNYAVPIRPGDTIPSHAVAEVVASRRPDVEVGDLFSGSLGWVEHALRRDTEGLFRVDRDRPKEAALGILGMHGLTARVGILDVASVRAGETVVISAAAGAVGLMAGQLAQVQGCRTVGMAGGAEKCRFLVERFGFDAAVDYRSDGVGEALSVACPDGVDVYFDNVGGPLQDEVVPLFKDFGRFVLCGRIALANLADLAQDHGRRDYNAILTKRLRKQGFLVYDHLDRFYEVREELWALHEEGRLDLPVSVLDGFEALPEAFMGLLSGTNIGRRLVRLEQEESDG